MPCKSINPTPYTVGHSRYPAWPHSQHISVVGLVNKTGGQFAPLECYMVSIADGGAVYLPFSSL